MDKQKDGKGAGIGFLGGMLDGITELVEKLGDLAEKGEKLSKSGNIKFKGGENKIEGVYGFSVKTGLGGKGVKVEPFGNIRKDEVSGQPVVHEMREPVVDIFEEDNHTLVIAEMPGISEKDITLEVKDDLLCIHAVKGDKKYRKEVLLPRNYPREKMTVSCNNGILEIKCTK